jgi:hypothetical protein
MLNPFKSATRAAVLAVALAGATLTTLPAQAAPQVSFSFSIGGEHFKQRHCMRDSQVRQLLRWHGFRDIRFTDRRGRIVQVRAERGRADYRIAVDSCRGRIIHIDRIRRR